MDQATTFKPRELEILRLLAEGLTNPEIGERLHLAHDTVRWYNKHIFEKLGAANRLQAVQRAVEQGKLPGPSLGGNATPDQHPPRPPVQYIANRDVHLAYQVVGNGPVDLLFIHGFLSHVELAWENPEYRAFFEHLGRFARVILFDKRGVGLSDRIQGAPSLETTMDDARCVLDAAGSRKAYILGTSEGGAAAVLLAATYPERVLGLILINATAKVVQTDGEPAWASSEAGFANFIESLYQNWGQPWAAQNFAPSRANDLHFRSWWAMVLRAASSPSSLKAVLNLVRDIDIRPLLPQIHVRTLILHKTGDRMVPCEAGQYLAGHMPHATFIEIPGADHIYFIESEALLAALAQFCQEPVTPTQTWLAILLYVPTREEPEPQLIAALQQTHPKHLLPGSRGVLAAFDTPTRAIHCARHLQTLAPQSVILHIGACQITDGTPHAAALAPLHQAAAHPLPPEILLTHPLHAILAGSGYSFHIKRVPSIQLFVLR